MAYGLAIAAAYVEMMLRRGMDVDEFAPRISFNFTAWGKIFEEVAKFRAGRRLYARMLRERFGAKNPKSWMFRTLIGGGGSAFVVQEPENNIVRGAYIALAAALSGAQTMALPTYDEAYTIPSAKAQLIALRTMQICGGSGRGRHGRSARGLVLRGGHDQRDRGEDSRGAGGGGPHGRHRGRHQVGRPAGRGGAAGLPVRAGAGLRRGAQGRRQLPRGRGRGRGRSRGRAVRLRSDRRGDAGDEAGARAPRARRPRRARGAEAPVRRGARPREPHGGHRGGGEGVRDAGRGQPSDERRLRRAQGACPMVSKERFAQGMTFDEYVKFVGTPDNLKREGSFGM